MQPDMDGETWMTDTIDLANAAARAYNDLRILADQLDDLRYYLENARGVSADAFADDVMLLFSDAERAADDFWNALHPEDDDDAA